MCNIVLHEHYEQSEAGADFYSTYEKIDATNMLMNVEMFLLSKCSYTQICSAHVS